MLFNSYIFVFLFLPLSLVGFYLSAKVSGAMAAKTWLFGASLFYYGWWNPVYLILIIGSIAANFLLGKALCSTNLSPALGRSLLGFGILANVGVLAWFKYANFGVDTINQLFGLQLVLVPLILPLAISFFTFQQVAFLLDAWHGKVKNFDFVDYALFVSFFPQLIAGPIVHHREMMPQFGKERTYRLAWSNIAVGITIFTIGLCKKILIADPFGVQAGKVFDASAAGFPISLSDAWLGVFAFTFQLYFDFSGYTDMAIGAARMFGIRLPTNFNSPYKATGAIEFWRRWHITLSRFLRDYLYIPLGGSRKGAPTQMANLLVTMLIGGLWHGAGWQFIAWGGVHGVFLALNHCWRRMLAPREPSETTVARWAFRMLTFLLVAMAWVLFRADSVPTAISYYAAMLGLHSGASFGPVLILPKVWFWVAAALALVWLAPNTQQIMRRARPVIERVEAPAHLDWLVWRPAVAVAVIVGVMFAVCVLSMSRPSEFLYYQF